jgi:hypothetical protein
MRSRAAVRALKVLVRRLGGGDARALVEELRRSGRTTRLAIVAAGIAGDPASVPWLLETMASPKHGRIAGAAFKAQWIRCGRGAHRPPPARRDEPLSPFPFPLSPFPFPLSSPRSRGARSRRASWRCSHRRASGSRARTASRGRGVAEGGQAHRVVAWGTVVVSYGPGEPKRGMPSREAGKGDRLRGLRVPARARPGGETLRAAAAAVARAPRPPRGPARRVCAASTHGGAGARRFGKDDAAGRVEGVAAPARTGRRVVRHRPSRRRPPLVLPAGRRRRGGGHARLGRPGTGASARLARESGHSRAGMASCSP